MSQKIEEEEYHEEIWSWFNYFLYKKGRAPSRLHLPVEDLKPYCHETINDEYEFTDKPVQSYPPGYRKICGTCLSEWVEDD